MKKKITDMFVTLTVLSKTNTERNTELVVRRIGGAFQFSEADEFTGQTIGQWYIGEMLNSGVSRRYAVIEKRRQRVRTIHTNQSLEKSIEWFNKNIVGDAYPHFTMSELARLS